MSWTPQTPRRRRAGGHVYGSGTSAVSETPPPVTPSRIPETVTTTITVTRSSAHRTSTRTTTTTATGIDGLSQYTAPSLTADDTQADDGYISSPSPIIINVPLPPSPSPAPAVARTLPTQPEAIFLNSVGAPQRATGPGISGAALQSSNPVGSGLHHTPAPVGSGDRQTAPATGSSSQRVLPADRAARYEHILAVMGRLSAPSTLEQPPPVAGVPHQPPPQAVVSHQPPMVVLSRQHPSAQTVPNQTTGPARNPRSPAVIASQQPLPAQAASYQNPGPITHPRSAGVASSQPAAGSAPHQPAAAVGERVIRVYIPPKPWELTRIPGNIILHVLSGGGGAGIYKTQEEVDEICEKAGWKAHQTRIGWDDAEEAYTVAWESGTIIIEPDADGPFANAPFRDIRVPNVKKPLPEEHPDPASLVCPVKDRRYYYVVFIGEEVGIFGSWHEAAIRTKRVKGGYCIKYEYWRQALKAYKDAFEAETLSVRPRRWGFFDPAVASQLREATKSEVPL